MNTFEASVGTSVIYDILVVDDSPQIRTLLTLLLDGEGYTVATAEDPLAAAAHIGHTALTLSDYDMPNGGGEAVARQMKIAQDAGEDPGVFLLMTGRTEVVEQIARGESSLAYPPSHVIAKPFGLDEVADLVNSILRPSQPGAPSNDMPSISH